MHIGFLSIDDADIFCQWMLEQFEHNNATVMFAPATGFYSTKGSGKNEVRMAYVLNVDDLNFSITRTNGYGKTGKLGT